MSMPQTRETMWALPICPDGSHLNATTNHFHYSKDKDYLKHRPLPYVRYRGESKKRSEMAEHPNNVDGGWQMSDGEGDTSEHTQSDSAEEEQNAVHSEDEEKASHVPPPQLIRLPAPHERFEENLDLCIPGNICVGLAQTCEGPSPYIFVGTITSVNKAGREFMMKPMQCTEDSWTKECVAAKWHTTTSRSVQKQPHYAVMAYGKKVNNDRTLPKGMQKSVEKRTNIVWYSKP